ncbi:DUF6292 family protein [Streptomyces sp. NPDC059340]|uniref:DUF6292 family protein n=1 Tax=Streptomyces sp. NPDC059340 TaxID=3346806 RepID=UPI0036CFAA71
MSAELSRRAGHYAAAVAERLLEADLPVTGIQSCGPWRDTDGEYLDVKAGISFTQAFHDQHGGGDCGLHWAGKSGWCLYTADKEDRYLSGVRWPGAGLLPEPRLVAAFVNAFRLDPAGSGSSEQPYYRQEGQDFPMLLDSLAPYLPAPPCLFEEPQIRFADLHRRAYENRVQRALVSRASDPLTHLYLRQGELTALLHMLEYAESSNPSALNRLLAADLGARAGRPPGRQAMPGGRDDVGGGVRGSAVVALQAAAESAQRADSGDTDAGTWGSASVPPSPGPTPAPEQESSAGQAWRGRFGTGRWASCRRGPASTRTAGTSG